MTDLLSFLGGMHLALYLNIGEMSSSDCKSQAWLLRGGRACVCSPASLETLGANLGPSEQEHFPLGGHIRRLMLLVVAQG